jgi:hypothetical protein
MTIGADGPGRQELARRAGLLVLLSLPILLFTLRFSILDARSGLSGDWAYFLQIYESARLSILEYHQFPWWNPWSLGGVPLYANPQFGLVSIQMPLVLLFGALAGLRLAVLGYMVLGFWGMHQLLRRLGAKSDGIALLLSYIWIFGSFPILHLTVGHLTFATYLLVPWFLLALLNIERPRGWLWLGLITAFLINQAVHYVTIQMLLAGVLAGLYRLARRPAEGPLLTRAKPYLLSIAVILPLVAHKLFHTLGYLGEYARRVPEDAATPVGLLWAGLTRRQPLDPQVTFNASYGWHEYGAYPSLVTLGLFVSAAAMALRAPRSVGLGGGLLLLTVAATLLLSLGAFAPFSPYALLHHVPPFDQMRVPSRWLGWTILAMILFLARLPRNHAVHLLLGLACLDLFTANHPVLNSASQAYVAPAARADFEQFASYPSRQGDMRLLEATQANAGELYGYEPIVNFYLGAAPAQLDPLTDRCGINQGCSFVLSGNATLAEWTPNRIRLRRTAPGPVVLNMNPGRNWLVNGRSPFPALKLFELKKPFEVDDPSPTLEVERND